MIGRVPLHYIVVVLSVVRHRHDKINGQSGSSGNDHQYIVSNIVSLPAVQLDVVSRDFCQVGEIAVWQSPDQGLDGNITFQEQKISTLQKL